jgi:hypothetical protein
MKQTKKAFDFDYESVKNKALAQLKSGKPLLSLTPKTMNSPVTPFIATKSIYFFENVESRFYLQYRYLLFAVLNFAFNGIFKSR